MYVKSIILDGFKSYGQRTEIHGFDPEFNAITGLNGTGKSNILDSICFVMGLSNLSQVRAGSLQDLIYKSGQAGVNKATVSIVFDNRNQAQSPPGFAEFEEITVSRQVVMGGKNKYMINGTAVQNNRVQDLFSSVQLNVNNPHFLIMQGRITKVLNMKPPEILGMLEEAAGTRMYEAKRQIALKTLEKKSVTLAELNSLCDEDLAPKLAKLRENREQFLELQRIDRELGHMNGLYQAWQYHSIQKSYTDAESALQNAEEKLQNIQETIKKNVETTKEIDKDVAKLIEETKMMESGKLAEIEVELQKIRKQEAEATADENSTKKNIAAETENIDLMKKHLENDEVALKTKEEEMAKVHDVFQSLKDNEAADAEAFALSQRKYEALCSGMELNDEGEAQTLQEQLTNARHEAAEAVTECKEANMRLTHCESQLKEKQKQLGSNAADYHENVAKLEVLEKEVASLEASLKKVKFSESRMTELQERRRKLLQEIRPVRDRIDNFEAAKPYTKCEYTDPEPGFNRKSVHGVVCKLFKLNNMAHATAIEIAAGRKLYNVVADNEVVCKKLLQRGNLQNRTTFIPLDKIRAEDIQNGIVKLAQKLVGEENVHPALSLLSYDKKYHVVMKFIFGDVFICKDLKAAKEVAFNQRIKRRCVTLDGDVVDPAGTLSGGAIEKSASILVQIEEIGKIERELAEKEGELAQIEAEIKSMSGAQEQWAELTRRLEVKRHESEVVRKMLQQTSHHRQQEEINVLKESIAELTKKIATCKETETKAKKKAKDLETKMNSKGYREQQLKAAEAEMKSLKQRAEKSKKNWQDREQNFETLKLEISELQKEMDKARGKIKDGEENLIKLRQRHDEQAKEAQKMKEAVVKLKDALSAEKSLAAAKNKDIDKKTAEKEKLLEANAELELEIKQQQYELKELQKNVKITKARVTELASKCKNDDKNLQDAQQMSDKNGRELEARIRAANDRRQALSRVVNVKAQTIYAEEEKRFLELQKRLKSVNADKQTLLETIAELDEKKKQVITLAFNQITKDFGSIFGTLLPGSDAKLAIPKGRSILEGLEIKVSLGGVWKECLSELSGGQRSLVALSLILAMLLFKPAPLYILDEIDAALDMSHTQNIGRMLTTHFKQSQFIIVSLKDGMFNNANVLFKTQFIDGMSAVVRTVNKRN